MSFVRSKRRTLRVCKTAALSDPTAFWLSILTFTLVFTSLQRLSVQLLSKYFIGFYSSGGSRTQLRRRHPILDPPFGVTNRSHISSLRQPSISSGLNGLTAAPPRTDSPWYGCTMVIGSHRSYHSPRRKKPQRSLQVPHLRHPFLCNSFLLWLLGLSAGLLFLHPRLRRCLRGFREKLFGVFLSGRIYYGKAKLGGRNYRDLCCDCVGLIHGV